MTDLKQKVKRELLQLFRRLERDFNKEDESRLLELRAQHLTDPDFFREWMMYDRLVVWSSIKEHRDWSGDIYNENMVLYACLKHAPEDREFYQEELKAWKEANGIK